MTDLCRRARQAAGVCGNTERGNLLIELVETVERLSAAASVALGWVARNTPMVDDSDPVYGPVAVEADRVRALLREALR